MAKTLDGLNAGFRTSLESMLREARRQGVNLSITSGARTRERQQQLWDAALKKYKDPEIADNYVARPGTSNHEDGDAVDLGGNLEWVRRNAARFGLYQPMSWEPWHWEPIGKSQGKGYTKPPQEGMTAGEPEERGVGYYLGAFMRTIYDQQPSENPMGNIKTGARPAKQALSEALESTGKDPAKVQATVSGISADLGRFMSAMAGQESGGDYNARNKRTGAAGRFQIMPGNWPSWSEEAGLGRNAARTPENQDRVASHKMSQYRQQFGSWEAVAVAWYAGPDDAAIWVKDPGNRRFDRRPGKGEPTIREYVASVMRRLG